MKKYVLVALMLCSFVAGLYGVICSPDHNKVRQVYSLKLEFEDKITYYERLDTMTRNDVRNEALQNAEEARKTYLKAFARLSESERKEYRKLEAECKQADIDYLGSEYSEDTTTLQEIKTSK